MDQSCSPSSLKPQYLRYKTQVNAPFFSQRSPGFDYKAGYMGFVVDKVTLG